MRKTQNKLKMFRTLVLITLVRTIRTVVLILCPIFFFVFIVPTLFSVGETIYSNGLFFVQSILSNRYFHLRGIIRKPLSEEYIIKDIFEFRFSTDLSRFKVL